MLIIFLETLSGLSVIRAYRRQARFVADNEHKLNENGKAYFALFASNRWYYSYLLPAHTLC